MIFFLFNLNFKKERRLIKTEKFVKRVSEVVENIYEFKKKPDLKEIWQSLKGIIENYIYLLKEKKENFELLESLNKRVNQFENFVDKTSLFFDYNNL